MELLTFAAAYIAFVLALIFVLLWGEQPAFEGTPISWAHWFLTGGACQGAEWVTGWLCGERGRAALAGLEEGCCERRNPAVQILFLAILAAAYYVYARDVFPLLPLPGLPAWHKATGTAAAAGCLALFVTASLADPGFVTPATVEAHCRLYPADGVLFVEGAECWTCGLPKPARSKHCRTCGRCIARFDHHCVWINNCVGLLNARWFLAFLLATAGVCAYGALLGGLAIRADMRRRDAWSMAYLDSSSGRLVFVGDSWRDAAAYIAAKYTTQVALVFFLAVAGWIVLGFSCYQIFRICQGVTTNESFKWREHRRALALQREHDSQRAQQDAITDRILAGASSSGHGGSELAAAFAAGAGASCGGAEAAPEPPAQPLLAEPRNIYDRGAWRNLSEVLFPWHHLQSAGQWRKEQ